MMEKIIAFLKHRGFVWPSAEIYGGGSAIFDWAPLGALLKNNLKNLWWQRFVVNRDDMAPVETAILTKKDVLAASGHLKNFTDPLVECPDCRGRWRQDEINGKNPRADLPRRQAGAHGIFVPPCAPPSAEFISWNKKCPACGKKNLTKPRDFQLMFGTNDDLYLRPETAQGMFVNFKNVIDSCRLKLPCGIAQIGKAFRNEITVGNNIFRTREFEQAEIEYFVPPAEAKEWFERWLKEWYDFFIDLGLAQNKLRLRPHSKEELAHYSQQTTDIEYHFPWGWAELAGVANRGDYDLQNHSKASGVDLSYFNPETNEKIIPFVIEPTLGLDRLILALIINGWQESDGSDGRSKGERVLNISPALAPVTATVLPLVKKEELVKVARGLLKELRQSGIYCQYDESGSIGRRYRRQDEIGTPWCITIDFDSLKDKKATIRHRDTMKQERVVISKIGDWLKSELK
ncbi:MAG: Glycine--tRNA ligase [Candidatus Berkelbacteria bacterium Licking1014_2]|uniref:glycine--tRNA ligase n=1 Tax=Candidatus Berkelbacteria bacterium Licking1014_2 TaxID=2017146 RepID=A0A554LV51_9BACT|nr:MAG: Glycine--tRNA ligase [Candidatus Berkelbacteria bacterium Licking1014_2]